MRGSSGSGGAALRLAALVRKESLQVVRDPSAILIAFVLPVVLLFLFAYAVSLDVEGVPIGVVLESDAPAASELAAAFAASRYFQVTPARHRGEVVPALVAGDLRGFVVIPAAFDRELAAGAPRLQVITDGSQPNTAGFVAGYAEGVVATWGGGRPEAPSPVIALEPRFWFNPELESRRFLVPGAIAIVMTMIGTLLTALVVAREWERGTMEALMSTPAGMAEILAGKLVPYFVLGLAATAGCALLAGVAFDVPLRGSWGTLLALSAAFLVPALGQGLLISTLARNQFVASQVAVFSGFLPSFLLSGFLFEIASMPVPIRALTLLVPARYFVAALQTVFLAGDVWAVLLPRVVAMLALGGVMFAVIAAKSAKSLDPLITRLGAQIVKELLSTLRDPRARATLIVPPLLQLLIFSFAATLTVTNVDLAVLDEDGGRWSTELVARLAAASFVGEVVPVTDARALGRAIDRREALLALRLPDGFSAAVVAGDRPAPVQVLVDGRRGNAGQVALRYVEAIAGELGAEVRAERSAAAGAPPGVVDAPTGSPMGSPVVIRHWFNPNLIYQWFVVPGLAGILAMFLSLIVTALSIARERELGTFDQLLVSPARPLEIIVGKTLPAVLVGSVMGSLMVVAGIFVFRVPFTGSVALLAASLVLFILSVVGVGLAVSALCRTQQQAILGAFAVGVPLVLTSGFATPVENMPAWLQLAAQGNPFKHFLVILEGSFVKALPPPEVAANAWPMAAIAAVTLTAAVVLVRTRLE